MAVQKITISAFLDRAPSCLVLDVRSPGEYAHAYIPGAYSLPLFTDEERAVVGTTYKKQSRERAIKCGLDFFGPKMRKMIEAVEGLMKQAPKGAQMADSRWRAGNREERTGNDERGTGNGEQGTGNREHGMMKGGKSTSVDGASFNLQPSTFNHLPDNRHLPLLVHCWRGGMRSAGVAWLLDLYGFEVYTLVGGYKAYRKWVREQFEKTYTLQVLGGYTGSGKTPVLHRLQELGESILDLEALAHHKGSAFGALGEPPQPTQEMFENKLAHALANASGLPAPLWLEDESQRIGNMKIPDPFWNQMRNSPVYFLDVPFEERLDYLTAEYGCHPKEKLVNAVIRIQKRLGGLETKNAIHHLLDDNHRDCFRILLKYYDKWYANGLQNRENLHSLLHTIACTGVLTETNARAVAAVSAVKKTSMNETA